MAWLGWLLVGLYLFGWLISSFCYFMAGGRNHFARWVLLVAWVPIAIAVGVHAIIRR